MFPDVTFRRRFSVNPCGQLQLPMGEMSFYKDWVNDPYGDPYPLLGGGQGVTEAVLRNGYELKLTGESALERLMGQFFPYATYKLEVACQEGAAVGFRFRWKERMLTILLGENEASAELDGQVVRFPLGDIRPQAFAVTLRQEGYSLYIWQQGYCRLLADRDEPSLAEWTQRSVFSEATASLIASGAGSARVSRVEWYLDGGISHADIRPIRYEDGSTMVEQGRVYLTVSSRQEVGGFQGVLSWNPTLADFRMEGAIFYDCGDDYWGNDVAASIVYDRKTQRWIVWACAFSHGHILMRGATQTDPRFGIQVLDMRLMEPAAPGASTTEFLGFEGDEDPAIICVDGLWHLAVCRSQNGIFTYYHFVSENPLDGFVFRDKTPADAVTGGSFFPAGGRYWFACGYSPERSRYHLFPIEDFTKPQVLRRDYDDGGFRGWGSIFALPAGRRERYYWITFDRHKGSDYTWSYGNLYVYEADGPLNA